MYFTTPTSVKRTDISFDEAVLSVGSCGLHRAPLHLAAQLMPSMAELIESVPVTDPENYEIDIKVHMLMAGQYPCIPNWHCDNVPRGEDGIDFSKIDYEVPPMLLWISDGPSTEFLSRPMRGVAMPDSHRQVGEIIREANPDTQFLQPNTWTAMFQDTPHRGTQADKTGWRVFARVTPKEIAPARPVESVIRRHAQVYLDPNTFSW